MKNLLFIAIAIAMTVVSCKKEETNTPETNTPTPTTYTNVGSSTLSTNEEVTIFAMSSLQTGYNAIFIEISDANGNVLTNKTVSFLPMMDMGTMQHSSPFEQAVLSTSSNMYEGAAIFTMASMAGTWTLDVTVDGETVNVPVTVAEAPTKLVGMYTGTDSEIYIVSLVPLADWEVGMNDLEIMIHKRESMMSFPAVEDMTVVLTPEMTSMNHGSPNNVSPVHIGNGHYNGDVNFTMTGDWRLHFELSNASGVVHNDAFLDILF